MRVALGVQRYGAEINGGAELHARYIAEHLAKHVEVEVLTTCATDYLTWRNVLPVGVETVRGVTVRRFAVSREREPTEFGQLSEAVFTRGHSIRDELAWLEGEGPTSRDLIAFIAENERAFDFFVFFSVRYYHAYYGARAVPGKAILVPTAERDGALGLSIFPPVFRGVRAFMYNSFEERALIQAVSNNRDVPGVVVGIGSEIPAQQNAARFRQKFGLRDRFAIYIGRIDENKGCGELFDFFQRYSSALVEGLHLVLIGNPIIPIPDHPKIHHLGFVDDQDKFDALAAAEVLIMPSYLESLSMVALEAWALGRPVLANGRCDVLKGQCIRSNGGLYYDDFDEFLETLQAIDLNPSLAAALGRNGREYYRQNYTWPIIERKYLDMLERLAREPRTATMESMPGWFARRRNVLPAANDVLARLPTGPALQDVPRHGGAPAAEARPPAVRRVERVGRMDMPDRGERARRAERRPQDTRPKAAGDRRPYRGPHRRRRLGGRPRRPGNR